MLQGSCSPFAIEERGSLAVGVVVFADFDIGVERSILFKSALPSEQVKSKAMRSFVGETAYMPQASNMASARAIGSVLRGALTSR